MAYLTLVEYLARFGERETIELTNETSSFAPSYDADKVTSALDDATEVVEGYIGGRYGVPLATVPGIVKGWTAALARQTLYVGAGQENEAVRLAADRAFKQLLDVQAGRMSLPLPEGSPPLDVKGTGTAAASNDGPCPTITNYALDRYMGPFSPRSDLPCWRR